MKVVATPGAEDVVAGMGAGGAALLALLFLVVVVFLAPLLLQIAVRIVTKQKVEYKDIFLTYFKILAANTGGGFALGFLLGFVFGVVDIFIPMNVDVVKGVSFLASLPLMAYFYGYFIRLSETGRIGIGKGALVMLVHLPLVAAFVLLLLFLGLMGR